MTATRRAIGLVALALVALAVFLRRDEPQWNESSVAAVTETSRSLRRQQHRRRHRARRWTTATASSGPFDYEILSLQGIKALALQLGQDYPDLVRVTTAQAQFGLAAAGGKPNYFLTLQDYVTHPPGSDSASRLPEVFWSGALHGDERVGPTAVLQAARVLLAAADCEARLANADNGAANGCRASLQQTYGLDDAGRQWLARLVATRRIVVLPVANALGYAGNVREENGVDPNRDFPFDLLDDSCMRSVAARVVNEIFRDHMFQLSLTFHAGMEAVGYEWGAPSYEAVSPDNAAQRAIASAYSYHGGAFSGSPAYPYGIMNKLVYPVRGGMEDWAYAQSWSAYATPQCSGYPAAKTTYNDGTLRAFNILVEASDLKTPYASKLGSSSDLLSRTSDGNGYISRALRIGLVAAELVEPYVRVVAVNGTQLERDVVPAQPRDAQQCRGTRYRNVSHATAGVVTFSWQVGGGVTVDSTRIWYAKWRPTASETLDCVSQPPIGAVESRFTPGTVTSATQGLGLFSPDTGAGTLFKGKVDLAGFAKGDSILVYISARVDSDWALVPKKARPLGPARSHVVNARTNASWSYSSSGRVVQGRLDWFSIPFTVNIV